MYKEGCFYRTLASGFKSAFVLGMVFMAPMTIRAATVTLAWDASTTPGVAGYNIYYGASSRSYTNILYAGNQTTLTVSNLTSGVRYFFSATAYDSFGIESDYSIETNYVPPAANQPPAISSIGNVFTSADTQVGPLAFIVGDAESPATSLTVSANSSDLNLFPLATIHFSGSASNRTITLNPATGQSGSAQITVSVSDGTAITSTSFQVTVVSLRPPPNNPPTISAITNQYTPLNTATAPIPFTIADAETAASSLTVSGISSNQKLVPDANIVFGGSDANRTVVITPAKNQSGAVNITVAVSDGTDSTSNTFVLNVQTVSYTVTVKGKGHGSFLPNLNGKTLPGGQSYTIMAMPDAGQQFTGWEGSISSSTPSLTFVLTSNIDLTGNFDVGSPTAQNNTYAGLFYEDDAVRQSSSGGFSVRTTSRNSYSGKLLMSGRSYPFTGKLDAIGQGTSSVNGRNGVLTLNLHIGSGNQADQIFGLVTDGKWSAALAGDRAVYGRLNPSPLAGAYTMVLPGQEDDASIPMGDSAGSVRVNSSGVAVFSGTLADGTKVTQTAPISPRGEWPFYASASGGGVTLLGWISVGKEPSDTPDLAGLVSWVKTAGAPGRYYTAGFNYDVTAMGSAYVRPSAGGRVINVNNGNVSFTGGNLASPFTNSITLGANSKVTNNGKNRLILSFAPANGTFRGTVADPNTGAQMPYSGAVLQKFNIGCGSLLGSSASSQVLVGE